MPQFTEKVIKYFRPKKQGGTSGFGDITYIGAEERFVSALRNSSLNNLEEQLIIGTDTYAIEGEDSDGNKTESKYFCPLEKDSDLETADLYYKLYTTYYKDGASRHYYFDENNNLHFSNFFRDSEFDSNGDLILTNNDENKGAFSFDNNGILQIIPETIDSKTEILFFHNSNNAISPLEDLSGDEDAAYNKKIITKESATMNPKEGQRKAFREKVINHLRG